MVICSWVVACIFPAYSGCTVRLVSLDLSPNIAFGSSATFGADGNVYVGHDALWSFTQKGDISWVYPFDDFSHASPAVGLDGTIYASGGSMYDLCAWRPDGDQ